MKTLLLLAALAGLTSCTVTISPDGSKSGTVNGTQFLRAVEILATK